MSRFTEAIEAESVKPRKGPPCSVGTFVGSLAGEDLDDFNRLIQEYRNGDRTMTSVARILERIGVRIAADRLTRHFRGQCACNR